MDLFSAAAIVGAAAAAGVLSCWPRARLGRALRGRRRRGRRGRKWKVKGGEEEEEGEEERGKRGECYGSNVAKIRLKIQKG